MKPTLYQHASEKMRDIIQIMLSLSEESVDFHHPKDEHFRDLDKSIILLCGKGSSIGSIPESIDERKNIWLGRSAISFGIERSATALLYRKIQPFIETLVDDAFSDTASFTKVTAEWVYENPSYLPVIMHVLGIFSKRELQKEVGVGSVSDTGISKPSAKKLANLLSGLSNIPSKAHVKERIKGTTEGIVRDLIGRLLLEDFVAKALENEGIPFLREKEYSALSGVIYDFRADFVIPDSEVPKAFIEVRRSSSAHASLYAKDKMFSAINWKGKHEKCLGILIVDGPWTQSTLEIMSRIFDYVVPIEKSHEVAKKIKQYLDGDESVLRWLIQFKVMTNTSSS